MSHDYEFLTTDGVGDYLKSLPGMSSHIDPDNIVQVDEIGDGNLNLVFIVRDAEGKSLCVKQALPYVRMVGEGWPMTPERSRLEAESLQAHRELIPEHVVEVIHHDDARHTIVMEDLSDHYVWRTALNKGLVHDGAAEAMGRYVAALAFGTSLFAMERNALGDAQKRSVNPQLCTITEDLVFTEPSVPADRNSTLPANEVDARELTEDREFFAAMSWAKWAFMTHGEALIHGDLHTGSVMVRAAEGSTACDSVKAFDSEFAFYGPVAFDIGALWANFIIAAARATALGEHERADWALSLVERSWDAFEDEFRSRWPQRHDQRMWDGAFLEERLTTWRWESWVFAAAKMSRRIVGAAKTKDIETLPESLREGAARGVLRTARAAVRHHKQDSSPSHLVNVAREILQQTATRSS